MTLNPPNKVTLQQKDWLGLITLTVSIIGSVFFAYQSHDRLLTEIAVRQQLLAAEQDRLREDVEELKARIRYAPISTVNAP